MDDQHEYAVLGGFNRAKVGRYIFAAAAALSSLIVFVLLSFVVILKKYGLATGLPPIVMSFVSAGAVYAALYWLFNRHGWRLPVVSKFLRVPDLSGQWICEGQTLNPDKSLGNQWQGEVTIRQSWDKIRVRLKTAQSGSNSVAAALHWDEIDGYKLLYHYRNEPKIGEVELRPHHGFAELTFSKDGKSASGEYFNGIGRFTFGTLDLKRS